MGDTILVTGGAGYIGSHVNRLLAENGIDTVVLDNLSTGHGELVQWGRFVHGDLRDPLQVEEVFSRHRFCCVMHLAGFICVGESVDEPDMYYRNNVCGTQNLLAAMVRHRVPTIIFSSTCAIYGPEATVPMDEHQPIGPRNPYGRSKLMAEWLMEDFCRAYGLSAVMLRYFNASGAAPDARIGEWHDPETHLIPNVLDVALGRKQQVEIFGTDYDTADGTCVRDYVHVQDIAAAHLRALTYTQSHKGFSAFNLGNGTGYSVRQVIEAVGRVTGKAIATSESPRRAGDAPALVAAAQKARTELGWQPTLPQLEAIVETAWNWHRRRFGA